MDALPVGIGLGQTGTASARMRRWMGGSVSEALEVNAKFLEYPQLLYERVRFFSPSGHETVVSFLYLFANTSFGRLGETGYNRSL